MTDSLICSQLGVPNSSSLSGVQKSNKTVPISLRDYTLKQTAHKGRRNTPGKKHEDIYIGASQPMQQKQGLGKNFLLTGHNTDQIITSPKYSQGPVQVLLSASWSALPLS